MSGITPVVDITVKRNEDITRPIESVRPAGFAGGDCDIGTLNTRVKTIVAGVALSL